MTRTILLACVASLAIACGSGDDNNSPTAPSEVTGSAPFSTTDLVVGSGAEATAGQRITVNYTGWLYSDTAPENKGRRFESSLDPGRTPYPLTLGARQVIAGWEQGIPGMRVGGRRRIVIPPDLAYGASSTSGANGIPPNATLLFEVELVSIP